jgi:hypothetical protein
LLSLVLWVVECGAQTVSKCQHIVELFDFEAFFNLGVR